MIFKAMNQIMFLVVLTKSLGFGLEEKVLVLVLLLESWVLDLKKDLVDITAK